MSEQRLESDHDVEQILRIAVKLPSSGTELGLRDRLNQSAQELGVTPEQLQEAEARWAEQKTREADMNAYVREQRGGFIGHLIPYLFVNGFWIFDNIKDGEFGFPYMTLFWGLGLAWHAMSVFNRRSDAFQEEFEKWRKKRDAKSSP